MNESFNKLDNEFNVSASPDDSISREIEVFEQKKNSLVQQTIQIKTLEDKEFLQTEIKSLIDNGKKVLETVQKDVKIGTAARTIEVYAKLLSSLIEGIRELRELNQTIANMQMFRDPEEPEKTTVNIKMTGKELLKMMKEAKESSQIKAIDATFQTEGEPENESE